MPRYLFNISVRGQKPIPDPDGDELSGDRAAIRHAKMVAQDMLGQRHLYRRGLEHWTFVITDQTGRRIGVVPFQLKR
jgi:hypothetical protein